MHFAKSNLLAKFLLIKQASLQDHHKSKPFHNRKRNKLYTKEKKMRMKLQMMMMMMIFAAMNPQMKVKMKMLEYLHMSKKD